MRVLHVDTGRELRGGQRQALLLGEALAARGEQVSFLARTGSPLFRRVVDLGLPVYSASFRNMRMHSAAADIVHAHDARAHTLAAIASRPPFVVSRRVVFPVRASYASRWKYRRAHSYLAVSEAVRKELIQARVPPHRICVVHDAVGSSEYLWSWQSGAPVVTFASSDPAKGSDLIRSAAVLWGPVPLQFSSNLTADLPHASAFLYITRSEGLGSAALLAMSMGVPVIASAVGGLLEIFENGVSGMHVANEPTQIAASVSRLLTDRETAERISRNGYERVRDSFNLDVMVARTLSAYRSAL